MTIRWDSAVDFEEQPYDVAIDLTVDDETQRMVCSDVRFTRRQGGPPIETTRLWKVKVTPLRELAARWLSAPLTSKGVNLGKVGRVPDAVADRVLLKPSWRAASRISVAEQVRLAAEIYLRTNKDYVAVVAGLRSAGAQLSADEDKARAVARKRIEDARKLGLVPPAGAGQGDDRRWNTRPRLRASIARPSRAPR